MIVINENPFSFAPIQGRLNFPNHSLTLIVKGTFDLKPGEKAVPADEQFYPTGDEFYPDDDEQAGSLRYESDFAYFKPRADILLVGSCHAPGGKPIPTCQVTFRVGSKAKSLSIFGDRYWKRSSFGRWTNSDPVPFTKVELRYENSFGGKGYKKNPVGKGLWQNKDEKGRKVQPLPNIEVPAALIGSTRTLPEPAGFGPLNRMWEQRHSKMGTYTGNYLKERWPWFPKDFDWGHFNAAAPDQQVEGYLQGEERLYFENLHPEHTRYEAQLPGLRVRCFLNNLTDQGSEETQFAEVPMNLDTLWVDSEAEKLVLVWRGWTDVLSDEYQEVRHVFIMAEPIEDRSRSLEQCHGLFLSALADYEKEWGMAPEEPEAPETTPETAAPGEPKEPVMAPPERNAAEEAQAKKDKEELAEKIMAQTSTIMAQLGINLDSLPPELREKTREQQVLLIRKFTADDPAKIMVEERKEMEVQMANTLSQAGIDLDNLPPLSEKAKAEQLRFMKELGINYTDIMKDPELGKFWGMMGALLPKMGLNPENLDPLIEEAKKHGLRLKAQLGIEGEEERAEAKKEEAKPPLTREVVKERAAQGESFAGKDLHGLDLSGLELKGIDFLGANFAGVSLKGANLAEAILTNSNMTGADLSEAQLANANLEGADLSDANLTKAYLAGANLTGATLNGAFLAEAELTEANLTGAKLAGTILSSANLTGANLGEADLSKANLEKACLKDADLTEGKLTEAILTAAVLTDAIFEKAILGKAVLDKVEAKDANFSEADLSGAKLRNSILLGADFSKCLLHATDFQGADLSEASVEGAKGIQVNFRQANLRQLRASERCDFSQGSFPKAIGQESIWHDAQLAGADFSFSRMEGADFTKANLEGANLYAASMKFSRFTKANLKKAKLVLMNLFEGSLEKADLTEADLRGSNLYSVEFLDAVVNRTNLEGANLKMTKLYKKG